MATWTVACARPVQKPSITSCAARSSLSLNVVGADGRTSGHTPRNSMAFKGRCWEFCSSLRQGPENHTTHSSSAVICTQASWLHAAAGGARHGWSLLLSWHGHLARGHDMGTWSPAPLAWHNDEWLSEQRLEHSGFNESRTRTRAQRSKVHRRWEESIEDALLASL